MKINRRSSERQGRLVPAIWSKLITKPDLIPDWPKLLPFLGKTRVMPTLGSIVDLSRPDLAHTAALRV